MSAIENIRRDLRDHAWLRYTDKPFAGAIHNFARPLRERFKARQWCGPYYWSPATPGGERGFYQHSKFLACSDSTFDLRLEEANNFLEGNRTLGYYCDEYGDSEMRPIIARLPHGRGFLAGWTMGEGMCAAISLEIYETEYRAALAAHAMAEREAEREREYQASQRNENEMGDTNV